jgi:hypothetical protein
MTDFSNLQALDINGETLKEYTFDYIPGTPSIWFAIARDLNPDFLNERLRMQAEAIAKAPMQTARQTPTAASLAADIEKDRLLLARTCAKKWGTPPQASDGSYPEFSAENCYAFLKAVPVWMLDPLRGWASNVGNFIPEASAPVDPAVAAEVGNV